MAAMNDRHVPSTPSWHPRRDALRGAYIELAQLTGARFAVDELALSKKLRARGAIAGTHHSRARGRGLEFEEVRAYQAGDDIRAIDWRVTARSGRPFTKLFREERERPLLLLVDQRAPMFFGSRTCFKSVTAAWLGAAIAWAGLHGGDRIGGIVPGVDATRELRPRHTRSGITAWLRALHEANRALGLHAPANTREGDAETAFGRALADLRRSARPGSAIVLISDFDGAHSEFAREQLYRLAQHNTLSAIQVYDPLEAELPPPARYTITDGTRRLALDSGDATLRAQHRRHFADNTQTLRALFGSLGAQFAQISTSEPPLRALENGWRAGAY
jgi:uncharacterized protein (DUF58 family)